MTCFVIAALLLTLAMTYQEAATLKKDPDSSADSPNPPQTLQQGPIPRPRHRILPLQEKGVCVVQANAPLPLVTEPNTDLPLIRFLTVKRSLVWIWRTLPLASSLHPEAPGGFTVKGSRLEGQLEVDVGACV